MDGKKKDKPSCEMRGIQCRKARQNYSCFGCRGEVPIPKGTEYYRVTIKVTGAGGETGWMAVRLCQRCREMMRRKLERAKNGGHRVQLSPGSFCYARLGKDDRAWWDSILNEARERQLKERSAEIEEYVKDYIQQQLLLAEGCTEGGDYAKTERRMNDLDNLFGKEFTEFFTEEIKWRNAVDEVDKELQGGRRCK